MKQEHWIDILKVEPAAGQAVLVALNTGLITVGYRKLKKNSHNWQLFGDIDVSLVVNTETDFVTHWMLLPDPPDFKSGKKSDELYKYPSHYRSKK